jgi:exo-beta-1,3-glucanase (GH17 family)
LALSKLEAIKQTKVNMQVYLGNYPVPDDNGTAYNRQKLEIQQVLQTYGTDHIAGITVGNEFILKYASLSRDRSLIDQHESCSYVTEYGSNDPNSAIGNAGTYAIGKSGMNCESVVMQVLRYSSRTSRTPDKCWQPWD